MEEEALKLGADVWWNVEISRMARLAQGRV